MKSITRAIKHTTNQPQRSHVFVQFLQPLVFRKYRIDLPLPYMAFLVRVKARSRAKVGKQNTVIRNCNEQNKDAIDEIGNSYINVDERK